MASPWAVGTAAIYRWRSLSHAQTVYFHDWKHPLRWFCVFACHSRTHDSLRRLLLTMASIFYSYFRKSASRRVQVFRHPRVRLDVSMFGHSWLVFHKGIGIGHWMPQTSQPHRFGIVTQGSGEMAIQIWSLRCLGEIVLSMGHLPTLLGLGNQIRTATASIFGTVHIVWVGGFWRERKLSSCRAGYLLQHSKDFWVNRVTASCLTRWRSRHIMSFLNSLEVISTGWQHPMVWASSLRKVSRVNTIYASDPVFYLHHTQVDRLWWLWQQQDLEARINQYEGPKNNMRIFKNMTQVEASLEDIVEMGGFADDILVRDLMSTQSDLLCYSY